MMITKKCPTCKGNGGWRGHSAAHGEQDADCGACEGTGEIEVECDHDGWVVKGECERCGERGLESDAEVYEREAPR